MSKAGRKANRAKRKVTIHGERGDCFEAALHFVIEAGEDADLTVVHGLPIGQGEENEGLRFWHAWVEETTTVEHPEWPHPITTTWAIDKSNGKDICLPAAFYYNVGQIDPEHTYRYTRQEAIKEALASGHYGPWVEDDACEVEVVGVEQRVATSCSTR